MALPSIIDTAQQYLFHDVTKMVAAGVPQVTAEHIVRLRDIYNHWLSFPSKKDAEMVLYIQNSSGVGRSQSYEDLKIVKALLGNFQKTTQDYHRYRFLEMIKRAYDKAEAIGDTRSMVAAADKYAKYTRLDKDDEREARYDKIQRQPFKFTDDPSVIGIKPVPNIREKIKAKKEQYWNEDVQDITFEEIEFEEDKIFSPTINVTFNRGADKR